MSSTLPLLKLLARRSASATTASFYSVESYFDRVERTCGVDDDSTDFDELQRSHEQRELYWMQRHAVFGRPGAPAQRQFADGAIPGTGHIDEDLIEVELGVVLASGVGIAQCGDQLASRSDRGYLRG